MNIEFKRSTWEPVIYCCDESGNYYDVNEYALYKYLFLKGILEYCMTDDIDAFFENDLSFVEQQLSDFITFSNLQPCNT